MNGNFVNQSEILLNTVNQLITVNDKMQQNYVYQCREPVGKNFDPGFKPQLTPMEILAMGAFGGRYMRDCRDEFPKEWYIGARLLEEGKPGHDKNLNYFKVEASQPISIWKEKGWIHPQDPRGWFQWYCRYYMGRRTDDDERQINRWRNMNRHIRQLELNCKYGDLSCRKGQRQALLHWAYDSRFI